MAWLTVRLTLEIDSCAGEDKEFLDWSATILGPPNTNMDNRIYFLTIKCGESYPAIMPEVHFTSKINIPCVN